MSIIDRIGARMRQLGYNQRSLAEDCGVTEAAMSRYFNGTRTPKVETLVRMAKALGVSTDYILDVEISMDDFDLAKMLIYVNVDKWSAEEKLQLINYLSKKGE